MEGKRHGDGEARRSRSWSGVVCGVSLGRSYLTVLARASMDTWHGSKPSKALAHSLVVAPVVRMSSTINMRLPLIIEAYLGLHSKAFEILPIRSVLVS